MCCAAQRQGRALRAGRHHALMPACLHCIALHASPLAFTPCPCDVRSPALSRCRAGGGRATGWALFGWCFSFFLFSRRKGQACFLFGGDHACMNACREPNSEVMDDRVRSVGGGPAPVLCPMHRFLTMPLYRSYPAPAVFAAHCTAVPKKLQKAGRALPGGAGAGVPTP